MFKAIRRRRAEKLKTQLEKVRIELDVCCKCLLVVGNNIPFKEHYQHLKMILELEERVAMDKLKMLGAI